MRTVLWWTFVAMLVVGVIRVFPVTSPPEVHAMLTGTSSDVEQRVESFTNPLAQLLGGEPAPVAGDGSDASAAPADNSEPARANVEYDRDDWEHWIDVRSCWTVREQVLARDAQPGSLRMLDENSRPTTNVDKACAIESGTWIDPYTGDTFTDPSDLDIDHLAPLAWAHENGAAGWSDKRKRTYANDLSSPTHLLAVSASENRSKGAAGPDEYRPPNKDYWCEYGNAWDQVTSTWDLSVDKATRRAIADLQTTC